MVCQNQKQEVTYEKCQGLRWLGKACYSVIGHGWHGMPKSKTGGYI
nr:MAG TPA: hypothetical protein [Caudoviricetes sp.]